MKKLLSTIIICGLLTCSAFSCGNSEKSSKVSDSTPAASDSAKEEKTEKSTDEDTTESKKKDKSDKKEEEKTTESEKKDKDEKNSVISVSDTASLEEAREVVKKYVESTFSKDADTLIDLTYPKALKAAMESSGMLENVLSTLDDVDLDTKLNDFTISDEDEMSEKAIQGAAQYYKSMGSLLGGENTECNITAGYAMTMNTDITYNGESEKSSDPVSVIMIEGEGWKVLPMGEEDLLSLVDMISGLQ
ncbi:MAG: hypothetical protein J6Y64_04800 [Ruminococcus sp.]|nr:hypothetical protein [Ruminococcus sp.]